MSGKNSIDTSRTDWTALESLSDEDIDYSDIPPLTDEFFERAILRIPAAQAGNLIKLEPDVMKWFRSRTEQSTELVNTVLRQYIENNK